MPKKIAKDFKGSEISETTNPLKKINSQLKAKLSLLKKEQIELDLERDDMKTRIQGLLAKRRQLLIKRKEDEDEKKRRQDWKKGKIEGKRTGNGNDQLMCEYEKEYWQN